MTTNGWIDRPSRRAANSVASSCHKAPTGRIRNWSNVPALMWRAPSSTGLTVRSASPNERPDMP
jgi:hypothetical protein